MQDRAERAYSRVSLNLHGPGQTRRSSSSARRDIHASVRQPEHHNRGPVQILRSEVQYKAEEKVS